MRTLITAATALLALVAAVPAHAAPAKDDQLPFGEPWLANYIAHGVAKPISTARTIPFWHGQYTDPTNGVTYAYNMVGKDPAKRLDTTVPVDLVPLNFVFAANAGFELDGSDDVARPLASPIFQPNDYTSTPTVTSAPDANKNISWIPGGALSAGNTGVQYEDAVMRSQFNAVGTTYHLRLGVPTVQPAQTIKVPANQGSAFQNARGVAYGAINESWGGQQLTVAMNNLHLDPTHLAVIVTNNVFVLLPGDRCCIMAGTTRRSASAVATSGVRASSRSRPTRTSPTPLPARSTRQPAPISTESRRSVTRSPNGRTIPSPTTTSTR
jgi:hypothetical protein